MALADVLRIVIKHEGDDVITNPNSFAIMAMIPNVIIVGLRPLPSLTSDLSNQPECVVYKTMTASSC